ncbi:alpha/beta-hydrolase [Dacryopinax primogenitus]|uniref:Alpha/beta-hydrolase n=1 Tax=Dacryopinax primogenitus (strain DJM 731) TaxID=1858805 RepID=M5GCK7_DACPD|nr:alpha/beta-hydrolase [Dacryopinax primogenitus]EJU01828.1 alpha/beta-hydrolase [Dacryopinax primogenitus]
MYTTLSTVLSLLVVLSGLSAATPVERTPSSWPWTHWAPKLPITHYPRPFWFPSLPPPRWPYPIPPVSPHPPGNPNAPGFPECANQFYVNTSALPLINFELPGTWAGLLPVSQSPSETKKLFFWYWPSTASGGSESLTIWLNGGPGCSSLTGFLMENGPISCKSGDAPVLNPYGWTTASDMIYIDQPVGTGYSVGTNDITTMTQLADQFYGFLENFYENFPALLQKPLTLAGESYSGKYLPYIAQRILSTPSVLPIKLNDPAAAYAKEFQSALMLSDDVVSQLVNLSSSCGYDSVMSQITYPPHGLINIPADAYTDACDTWDYMLYSCGNPCLSPYNVDDTCPLGADNTPAYFSRPDVMQLLHVPNMTFNECNPNGVFATSDGYDTSAYSETLLPALLPHLPRGITIEHGYMDALLIYTGDRIWLQNMTWGGKQGFQTAPGSSIASIDGEGGGTYANERGITYVELPGAGHLIPYDQPATALHIFKYVLGQGSL